MVGQVLMGETNNLKNNFPKTKIKGHFKFKFYYLLALKCLLFFNSGRTFYEDVICFANKIWHLL